uniref:Uncharacterized protein n=1 Tax=Salvator merianae TaxID=96440 RepID=A0A8D0C4A6_SALMN
MVLHKGKKKKAEEIIHLGPQTAERLCLGEICRLFYASVRLSSYNGNRKSISVPGDQPALRARNFSTSKINALISSKTHNIMLGVVCLLPKRFLAADRNPTYSAGIFCMGTILAFSLRKTLTVAIYHPKWTYMYSLQKKRENILAPVCGF